MVLLSSGTTGMPKGARRALDSRLPLRAREPTSSAASLPRNPAGKVLRRVLVDEATTGRS